MAIEVKSYNYKELRHAAIDEYRHGSVTNDAQNALGEWFKRFDEMRDWNGESFDADDGWRLYPVYKTDENGELVYEDDDECCAIFLGYELRP